MEENVFQKMMREREEWRTRFLAASPEEQERMLAEKKANREREEMERKQRIYDERKKRFMERADHQIKLLELLEEAKVIALEVIEKFDDKVLNNRLTNELNERLKEYDSSLSAKLSVHYDSDYQNNIGELTLRVSNYGEADLLKDCNLIILLTPTIDKNRVKFLKTKENAENNKDYLEKRLELWKSSKKDYDKIYNAAKKLEEQIRKYSELSIYVREFFKKESIIPSWYL